MKERPILFDAQMVRAILEGRKTQTRRVMKPQPAANDAGWYPSVLHPKALHYASEKHLRRGLPIDFSPYGQPGNRLWVRETWYCDHCFAGDYEAMHEAGRVYSAPEAEAEWRGNVDGGFMSYRADVPSGRFEDAGYWGEPGGRWRPSIHMPRWASRITLEVTGVRVERLQDISEEDAKAEGVETYDGIGREQRVPGPGFDGVRLWDQPHRLPFANLWESIHGSESWQANPWVWVLEFKRIEDGHDR